MNSILARRGTTVLRRLTSRSLQNIVYVALRNHNGARIVPAITAIPLRLKNSYATAAARPKAHTGRAAAKTSTSKSSKTATDKKKTTKKKTTKTKAKTKAKSAETTKKPKKRLTPKQKEDLAKKKQREEIKALKIAMLSPPKTLPNNSFGLVLQQVEHGSVAQRTEVYRNLSTEARERLVEIAKENTEANRLAFEQWVKSHTPFQIKEANAARKRLRALLGRPRAYADIKDPRQVKRPRLAYIIYAVEQFQSGQFDDLEAKERVSEIAKSWRSLTEAEKDKYRQAHEEEVKRYTQEYESVYGQPPKKTTVKPKKSETT